MVADPGKSLLPRPNAPQPRPFLLALPQRTGTLGQRSGRIRDGRRTHRCVRRTTQEFLQGPCRPLTRPWPPSRCAFVCSPGRGDEAPESGNGHECHQGGHSPLPDFPHSYTELLFVQQKRRKLTLITVTPKEFVLSNILSLCASEKGISIFCFLYQNLYCCFCQLALRCRDLLPITRQKERDRCSNSNI